MNSADLDARISVALCTYMGARFLEEQLGSLAEQSFRPAELVICDDRSTDDTVKILKRFQANAPFPVKIFENNVTMGVVKNFSRAISLCSGDYVAICDQDDIWLPERLEKTYRAIYQVEADEGADRPLLVHSDLMVGDEAGRVIATSDRKNKKISFSGKEPLKNLLVQNFVTGSTVLVNRSLIDMALPIPERAIMHDWWLALVAAARGKVISLAEATVIYRQHDLNIIGSQAAYSTLSLKKLVDLTSVEKTLVAIVMQGLELKKTLRERDGYTLPEYAEDFLEKARKNGLNAAVMATRYGIMKKPCLKNIAFIILLARGGYLKYLS